MSFFKKKTIRILSILFVLLQFFQPFSEINASTLTDSSNGIKIVSAKQTKESEIAIDFLAKNSTNSEIKNEISISDGVKVTEITDTSIVDKVTKNIIGKYYVKNNKIFTNLNPNVDSKEEITLTIPIVNFDNTIENTVSVGGTTTAIYPIKQDATKTNANQPLTSSPLNSKVENEVQKITPPVLLDGAPIDISSVLPEGNNNTIIDSASIVFKDKNGNDVSPSAVNADTNINLQYKWSIPNALKDNYSLKAGDYFKFKLPEGVAYKPSSGSLGDYGTFKIESDGTVTFTFTEAVENADNISGTFNYSSTISSTTTTGETTIVIPTKEGPETTDIVINPKGGNDISKTGQLTGMTNGKNATGITWDVTINTDGQELKNAEVKDTMPTSTGSAIVTTTADKISVYPLTVDLNGNVTQTGAPLIQGTDYEINDGTIRFIGAYAITHQAFKIEYQTSMDTTNFPDDGGDINFKNTAILSNHGKEIPAEASVDASYSKFLEKTFDGQDSNGSQKYDWHIDYNYGHKKITKGTTLVDTLSKGQIFTGTPTFVYDDGTVVDPSAYQIDYNNDKSVMTVTWLTDLNKGVKLSYQSQVTQPIGNDGTVISNDASSDSKEVHSGDHEVASQGLYKSVADTDYNNKTITWKFDINMARQEMTNWYMTDTIQKGLSVDYNSFSLVDKDHSDVTYKQGEDYQVTETDDGFKVEFLGNLKTKASDWYVLTYKTSFDTKNLPENGKWTNSASAKWTDQWGNDQTNNAQSDFSPKNEFKNDGSKSGKYNAQTKHITWTVVANYNQIKLESNSSISDPIVGDQDYVVGSAKLYEATVNKDGSYSLSNEVIAANLSYDSNSKTVFAKLPEGSNKAYVLIFETTLENKVIDQQSYNNTANYTNGVFKSQLPAQVSVNNSGNLVEKSGQQDPNDSAYATWNIWVNKAQSTLKNFVVSDSPSENQILDASSIKIYPGLVDEEGNFSEDKDHPLVLGTDYLVDLKTDSQTGKQELTISFIKEISTAYSIHYSALINSSKTNDTLSNTVSVSGDGEKKVTQTKEESTDVTNSGGSSEGKNTNLIIHKIDGDSQKAIAGVTFGIYSVKNKEKGQLLRTATTDSDGNIHWGNLKSGDYLLVEIKAPKGYVITNELANGKEISISYKDEDKNGNVNIEISNKKGKVTLTKSDKNSGALLKGAKFDLYQEDSDKEVTLITSLETDSNGQLSYTGLSAGNYYLVETAAPAGYQLDQTKHIFTVSGESDATIQPKLQVTNVEKTGSVVLTKTDKDTGKTLSGATFSLFDSTGKSLKTGLISDINGQIKVDGLKPGNYYFQETAAPAGYVLDEAKVSFTVELQTTTKVAQVSATNVEKTGSVVLTKTDKDTGKTLSGATFSLFDSTGKSLKTGLISDINGQIKVDGLKPGNYYFQETAAPAGYVLDEAKVSFTVELQTTTKVAQVSATNAEKTGSVVLTKTDKDTGKTLSGATFSLFDSTGKSLKTGLISDINGQIKVDGLKPGNYYFQETAAPAGYVLDEAKVSFTVELQTTTKVAQVSATNVEKTGSVVLTKTDKDTGKTLSGATFSLFDSTGKSLKTGLISDINGQIKVDGLKPGNYYFQETAAPAGYVLDEAKVSFTVELQTTTKVAQVSATNAEKTGSVVLTKTDKDTGKTLSGATFSLFDSTGKSLKTGLISDINGQIKVDGLKPGNYYFQETAAPAGYVLDEAKVSFTVELQTTTKVAQVSATNAEKTGSVVLTKTDKDTGKTLSGATFSLFDSTGKSLKTGLISDINGQIKVDGLKPGNYYFQETAAPAGYVLDEAKVSFTVELQTTTKVAQVSATNVEKTGSVVLTKTDKDTGKTLSGATFSLFDSTGKSLKTGLISDINGQIKVDGLKPGNYYFQETAAPAGYVLDEAKVSFTVELQTTTKVAQVSATNVEKTGSVVLTKTDKDTGKTLSGAKFNLYDETGKLVKFDLITDVTGHIKVSGLKPGNYYFLETSAPFGYQLNNNSKYSFVIKFQNSDNISQLTVTNAKLPVVPQSPKRNNLPKTGEMSNVGYVLTGFASLLGAVALLLMKKKQ